MKTIGIIAEFNPFHNGHKYLIEQAKELTGADCCVVVMSGDFVQRGAPAICNKYLRTEMALKCGADIVFELPAIYSLGSAEMFADGAVKLLCSLDHQIDYLCFGSESGDTEALFKCADIIEDYSATPDFKEHLSGLLKSGISYPSAFSEALSDALGSSIHLLHTPNNLLGIEYIRALKRVKSLNIPEPLAIKRIGSDHSDTELNNFSSAAAIRNALCSGSISSARKSESLQRIYDGPVSSVTNTKNECHNPEAGLNIPILAETIPTDALKIISEKIYEYLPITEDDFSSMFYMRLNTLTDEELFAISDINPDLIHKLIDYRGKKIVISELITKLKSKCFTYTAISRALFRLLLCPAYADALKSCKNQKEKNLQDSIQLNPSPQNAVQHTETQPDNPYLRLLGFKKSYSGFLRALRYSDNINIITKPTNGPLNNPCYRLDIYASNLYEQICFEKFKTGFTEELKTGPIIIP